MREFDLLDYIYQANASLGPGVCLPPGDDMGGVSVDGGELLVTVDQLVEGIHVDSGTARLEQIARKAITRNLSDVAAMGAVPLGAVCAAMLPRSWDQQRAEALSDHLRTTSATFACPLFGGDVSIWDGPLLLSVTVLAQRQGIEPVLRHTARAGDALWVSGQLGGSTMCVDGYTHHLDFTPRLDLGRALAGSTTHRPTAMLDLSDGLAGDVLHLLERDATLGAIIEVDRLPLAPGAALAAQASKKPAWHHALTDGEDYELLFTLAPTCTLDKLAGGGDIPLTHIGALCRCEAATPAGRVTLREHGNVLGALDELKLTGWEHGR